MASPTGVVTPEAVVLDFETAGLPSRLLSGLIDVALQLVLLVMVLMVGATAAEAVSGGGAAAAVYVGVFIVLFGYPVALETLWRGKTVGKAAMGLRVVTTSGLPVRFRHAAIRSILGIVDKWTAAGSIGVVAVLLTTRNQRIGDVVAGTIVLRERRSTRAQGPVAFRPPAGLEGYCATLDVTGMTQRDYVAVRSFLLRAHQLDPVMRLSLARNLALPLRDRLRTAVPNDMHPEVWLACLLAAQQARNAPGAAIRAPSVWDLGVSVGGPAPPPSTRRAAPTAGGFRAPG